MFCVVSTIHTDAIAVYASTADASSDSSSDASSDGGFDVYDMRKHNKRGRSIRRNSMGRNCQSDDAAKYI
jgi:hypothetical protein